MHSFIDNEGLITVGAILQQSTFPYQTRRHMILPANYHFINLIVSAEHIRHIHAGPQILIAST